MRQKLPRPSMSKEQGDRFGKQQEECEEPSQGACDEQERIPEEPEHNDNDADENDDRFHDGLCVP